MRWRILFLILILASAFGFAQNSIDTKPAAKKIYEFGRVTTEYLEMMLDSFIQNELQNDASARGFIINYGAQREIARNELLIRNLLYLRKFDATRISIVNGGFLEDPKTEVWIVPFGAKPPAFVLKAQKHDDIGKVGAKELKQRIKIFRARLEKTHQKISYVYIINFGNEKDVAAREVALRDYLYGNCRDCYGIGGIRMTFVRGGESNEPKTVFWVIPLGVEAPNLDELIK